MFFRMLKNSFTRGIRSKALSIITIAFGASLATAMLNVMLDIGDKINQELKTYGANIMVVPHMETLPVEIGGVDFNPLEDRAYLDEENLPKIKTIFWANNIVGFTPYLEARARVQSGGVERRVALVGTWFDKHLALPTGENFATGIKHLKPWWEVSGEWVREGPGTREAMVGVALARQLKVKSGDTLAVAVETKTGVKEEQLLVKGIVDSGNSEDEQIFVPLALVQQGLGLAGKVGKVEVSALTTPENSLARKAENDRHSLTSREFETWYCTAYVSAIAFQLEEVIPGAEAKAIRQVAQSEGLILGKIQLLMLLLTLAAVVSSALGISSLMTTKVLERSKEIGLLKAIGAEDWEVLLLFLFEAAATGSLGGALGYGLGLGFARIIGQGVFGSPLAIKGLVIPLVMLLSMGIALVGSIPAIRIILRLRPAEVLHGR
ncbi:MAG: ABC transporter permease [Clostridia bacterium]|nr:ABC transporter permease [Clostridia bacterium]